MRDRLFFGLAGLAAAGMIAVALAPLWTSPAGRPAGAAPDAQGWRVLNAAALSGFEGSSSLPVTAGPNPARGQDGVRFASYAAMPAGVGGAGAGARLTLGPDLTAAYSGRAVVARVRVRAVAATPSPAMMIGLSRGADVGWTRVETLQEFTTRIVRLEPPKAGEGPLSLRVWADPTGAGLGVEISRIDLREARA